MPFRKRSKEKKMEINLPFDFQLLVWSSFAHLFNASKENVIRILIWCVRFPLSLSVFCNLFLCPRSSFCLVHVLYDDCLTRTLQKKPKCLISRVIWMLWNERVIHFFCFFILDALLSHREFRRNCVLCMVFFSSFLLVCLKMFPYFGHAFIRNTEYWFLGIYTTTTDKKNTLNGI